MYNVRVKIMHGVASNLAISIITAYQRWISPYKGFRCAHSAYYGGISCSGWAKKIIRKHGLSLFLPLMQRRFVACSDAYEKISNENRNANEDSIEEFKDCPCMNTEAAYCCFGLWPF